MIIPIANRHSYNAIPRNKDLKLAINNSCNWPHNTLLVDHAGNCFVCQCEAWLPVSVGHITEFDSLEDIWTSPAARALQEDIDTKKFTHCAVDRCGILHHDNLLSEYTIYINIDPSCNLVCPSCRRDAVMYTQGPDYERRLNEVKHLVDLLQKFKYQTRIVMSGNGDPLASAIMRPLIHNFQPLSTQRIRLFTNGLLLEKQLENSSIFQHIDQYLISVDAGSQAVYEKVRRPGKFEVLLKNFEWLSQQQRQATVNFVVQQANWHDIENFVQLCLRFKFTPNITRLEDWGTWDDFADQDVIGNVEHPDHLLALQELRRVYALHKHQAIWGAGLPVSV